MDLLRENEVSVPVIFLSKTLGSPCSYLHYAMSVASRNNDSVWLLGDERNKHLAVGKYENIEKYSKSAEEFEKNYVHLSTNSAEVEKFCFSRWFILRDFMIEHGYEQILHLDTDILFFANSTEEAKRFVYLDCALTGRTSGHSSYWTLEGLTKFCEYVSSLYNQKDCFEFLRISKEYDLRREFSLDGGVCDMTFLEHYARHKAPHLVGELSILSNHAYYDHIISADEGFSCSDGRKQFQYIDGIPHGFHEKTQKLVPFATIHFQGAHNKHLIKHHHDISIQS